MSTINDGYSTMNDGNFLIVHRTFLFSYFRGCWRLDFFFCAQTEVFGHIMKRVIELAADVVIK